MIHIVIPGPPKGRTDPQAVSFGGGARLVQRKGTRNYEAFVAMVVREQIGHLPIIDYAVRLDILAVFARPGRLDQKDEPDGLIFHAQKPDRDNIEKAIQDGMKAAWKDDALVVMGTTVKAFAERTGRPRVELWLTPMEPVEIHGFHVTAPAPARPKRESKPKETKAKRPKRGVLVDLLTDIPRLDRAIEQNKGAIAKALAEPKKRTRSEFGAICTCLVNGKRLGDFKGCPAHYMQPVVEVVGTHANGRPLSVTDVGEDADKLF